MSATHLGMTVLAWCALVSTALGTHAQPVFSTGVVAGTVTSPQINEASGLAASRGNPHVLWTHNDHGDSARMFAITETGALLSEYVMPDVIAYDFEDLACGPGPEAGAAYLYVGDIGDNSAARTNITIYRVAEPPVYVSFSNVTTSRALTNLTVLSCVYPGTRRNAEALLVDPVTTSLFLASKDPTTYVYEAPYTAWEAPGVCTLAVVATITAISRVTAGDIAPDGSLVVLRAKDKICAWQRQPGESVASALQRDPLLLPLAVEPQGEALAFTADNGCYFTLSEGTQQPLYRYDRADALRAEWLLAPGAMWRWRIADASVGTAWMLPDYDDSAWHAAPAPLGSNYALLATVVPAATTLWFRTVVTTEPMLYTAAHVRALFDDACVLYLNGMEILRVNLTSNSAPDTLAQTFYGARGATWHSTPLAPALLNAVTCVFAAEVQQAAGAEGFATVLFDAQCEAQPAMPEPGVTVVCCVLGLWRRARRAKQQWDR